MESELPGIFRVEVVAKNVLVVSLGTQRQAFFAMSLFEEANKFFKPNCYT